MDTFLCRDFLRFRASWGLTPRVSILKVKAIRLLSMKQSSLSGTQDAAELPTTRLLLKVTSDGRVVGVLFSHCEAIARGLA